MEWPVVLYVANIIDYLRVVFLVLAYQAWDSGDRWAFVQWYVLSYALDAVDGLAARALGQESKLGMYLDMVIDRLSSCLCLHVAALQALEDFEGNKGQALAGLFYVSLVLVEVLAHGVVMFQSEVLGFHQKEMQSQNVVVRTYLGSKPTLLWACASYEAVPLAVIVGKLSWALPFITGYVFRAVANVLRLKDVLLEPQGGGAAVAKKKQEDQDQGASATPEQAQQASRRRRKAD